MSSTLSRTSTADKIEKLRRVMEARGLDAVVVCSYQNVSYFGGTTIMTQVNLPDRLAFLVARRDGAATLLVCSIETSQVRSQTDIADIRDYTEFAQDPTVELARLLRDLGLSNGSIGLDARRLPAASMATLEAEMSSLELIPIDDEIELAQAVKEPGEIDALRGAGNATLSALEQGLIDLPPGCTERQAASAIYSKLLDRGGMPLFMVFASGERTMQGHPESVDIPMAPGSIWRIDFGARFAGGINSDLARTGVVGQATPEQTATLAALRATQDAGFAAIESGRPAKEVFFAVQDEFRRQGLPFAMPHIGHGMGIGLHEYPMLQPRCDIPLQVGMVLNIEPMTLIGERGEGYHTEDLAVVMDGAPAQLLTPPQERLLIIPDQA
ncbi:MAG: aminopeptidase P family protein [Candidatus Dormibacteraeota bacterium]|uniref:Aminopeptidase P family protein n=1 Tax=Candidatus Dormiibacter inghamiae TaxID=3127013 RepID=A0A934K884_9BACT|nr:aminopeptidase P family protein [Candidatus Dormibacteraeota bacterium]MBJ7605274.1 aminopeptidase P family protein [Candidatus Dormibacteraeota bacterium]